MSGLQQRPSVAKPDNKEPPPTLRLFPPGKIYHIIRTSEDKHHVVLRRNQYFGTIACTEGMLAHHKMDNYGNALDSISDKLKGKDLFCHITLEKGERSELANLANEHL